MTTVGECRSGYESRIPTENCWKSLCMWMKGLLTGNIPGIRPQESCCLAGFGRMLKSGWKNRQILSALVQDAQKLQKMYIFCQKSPVSQSLNLYLPDFWKKYQQRCGRYDGRWTASCVPGKTGIVRICRVRASWNHQLPVLCAGFFSGGTDTQPCGRNASERLQRQTVGANHSIPAGIKDRCGSSAALHRNIGNCGNQWSAGR